MTDGYLQQEPEWITDCEEYRQYDGKRVLVKEKGGRQWVGMMRVLDTGPNGEKKEGHILITLTPCPPKDVPIGQN